MRVVGGAALAVAMLVGFVEPAMASGTYAGRATAPPRRPDAAKYHRGKQLFTGEAQPTGPGGPPDDQQRDLAALATRLPRDAGGVDLPPLAGRLSDAELDAIRYYLQIRFKVR